MSAVALWRPLPWQEALWLELSSLVLQKRLPHALLLVGGAGVGKRWFARALTAFALCEKPSGYACGSCRSCTQLAVGSHPNAAVRSEEHTSELQSLMRISYAVLCLKKKNKK